MVPGVVRARVVPKESVADKDECEQNDNGWCGHEFGILQAFRFGKQRAKALSNVTGPRNRTLRVRSAIRMPRVDSLAGERR